jgi:hypothetical protein
MARTFEERLSDSAYKGGGGGALAISRVLVGVYRRKLPYANRKVRLLLPPPSGICLTRKVNGGSGWGPPGRPRKQRLATSPRPHPASVLDSAVVSPVIPREPWDIMGPPHLPTSLSHSPAGKASVPSPGRSPFLLFPVFVLPPLGSPPRVPSAGLTPAR